MTTRITVKTAWFAAIRFAVTTWGLGLSLRIQAKRYPAFKEQLGRHDLTAQMKLGDGSQGRSFTFDKGRVWSKKGIRPTPDVVMTFRDARVAARILRPRRDRLEFLNAAKNSQLELEGPGP